MNELFRYAFIDESGGVTACDQNHFLVVAALSTDHPQTITRVVRQFHKKTAHSIDEIKAKKTEDRKIIQFLRALSKEPIAIFAVVLNHQNIIHPPKDAENIYRWAVSRVVSMLVERYPRIEVVLDKRYTKQTLRYRLEKEIRNKIIDLPQQFVLIRQEDSIKVKGLQAADFFAWSLLQKYERGDCRFYEIFAHRIIVEDKITKLRWDAEQDY